MKLTNKIICSIASICTISCIMVTNIFAAEEFVNEEYYDTKKYDVTIDIDENNIYNITEKILVKFKEPRHGIFRTIPYKSYLNREIDGKVYSFPSKAKIWDVTVEGRKFKKDSNKQEMEIKIGDEDETVNGEQEYIIRYKYRPHDDRFDAFDEVYFNVLPNEWPTPIDTASITINMPKAFDQKNLFFYCGEAGSQDTDNVEFTANGRTIQARLKSKIPRYTPTTVRLQLPQGYFDSQKTDDTLIAFMWILIRAPLPIVILLWILFGRDPKVIIPVTVMPPKGMTPTEVGYIVDGEVQNNDILALLFYWADKGYITIEEESKKSFLLTKLQPLPQTSSKYQQIVFEALFREESTVSTKSFEGIFHSYINQAQNAAVDQFSTKGGFILYTHQSLRCRRWGLLLSLIPLLTICVVNYCLYSSDTSDWLVIGLFIVALFGSYCNILCTVTTWKTYKLNRKIKSLIIPVILSLVMHVGIFVFICSLNEDNIYASTHLDPIVAVLPAVIYSLGCLFFACIMTKRTPEMNQLYGEVLGLREFIKYAEKERLERLVTENPSYFYNILPYAYVLGVSDKWAKQFEAIAIEPPNWYVGSSMKSFEFNSENFTSSISKTFNKVQNSLSYEPSSSSGSGGGGFSGGGGGGGGGGSW